MQILLLAPYCGGSHRAWAQGYAAHSRHEVTLLDLPARFWKWRMQGGAVTLVERARALGFRPDLILATDMVNLPAFLGLARDFLADISVALYCHENQLTYPLPPGEKRDLTYGMINWLSMLAADRVFFNSQYHLEDWFEELPRLLRHFPDLTHVHRVAQVRAKSEVLPVGCDLRRFDQGLTLRRRRMPSTANRATEDEEALTWGRADEPSQGLSPLILWNQRWEYDKAPDTFFRALYALGDEGIAFRVALAGSNVRQMPEEFGAARRRLGERVVHCGRADEAAYARLLCQADVVVSTALHEFFGVAVVEAIYCGCFPVLPHRLTYPELIPPQHHEVCLYEDFAGLVARLRWALTHLDQARATAAALRHAVSRFDWSELALRYDEALEALQTSQALPDDRGR